MMSLYSLLTWCVLQAFAAALHPEEQFLQGLKMPVDFVPSPVQQYVCHCGSQCCPESGPLRILPAFAAVQTVFSVGADFGWIPRGALYSAVLECLTIHWHTWLLMVGMVAGLRVSSSYSFYTPDVQWLTEGLQPWRVQLMWARFVLTLSVSWCRG